jgi:hypothetical protein
MSKNAYKVLLLFILIKVVYYVKYKNYFFGLVNITG